MRLTALASLFAFSATTILAQSQAAGGKAVASLTVATNSSPAASAAASASGSLPILDLDRYRQLIAAQKGHYYVVDFWATTCGPCRAELPGLVVFADSLRAMGVNFVTISGDDSSATDAATAFLDSIHAPAERYLLHTDDVGGFIKGVDKDWEGNLPAIFVYNTSGELVHSFIGGATNDEIREIVDPKKAKKSEK